LAIGSPSPESPVELETRIARLESDVAHVRTDVGDIKADLRTRFDRVDTRIDRLDTKIDALTRDISRAQIWALLLYIGLAAGMSGAMGRGFGWI
jgi:outer membrane murein-binding lipoprotein Lpp